MTKYKYSRKGLLKKLGFVFKKGIIEFPLEVSGLMLTDLLAKQPKQKSTGKVWFEEIPEENILVKKLSKSKPIRPTLQPIEKIPIRIKEQTETTILVNQWDLAHKVNQIIDRINLLSIKIKQ